MPNITDIKLRRDLKPASRGWSTSPNVYRDPTHYEVVGTGLVGDDASRAAIVSWLAANKPRMLPGKRSGMMTTNEVELNFVADGAGGTWLLVDYFTYSGG